MRWLVGLGLLGAILLSAPASATTLEPVGTFTSPIFVTSYPDDEDRLLVVEREGRVQLVTGGTTSTFLDATSLVGTIAGERGMWSIALAPDFASTGRLYAFYAGSVTGGALQLDEFTAVGDSVDLDTRRPVLTIEHSESPNHNGGQLQFGPDGHLYISTGDGDRRSINAQELTNLLGKILRIDPRPSGGAPYSVPADNPFVGVAGLDEIWSYGLRNPYRFSFDRDTGALVIGDVGRQRFEEIDYDAAFQPGRGDNYGWPCFEGNHVQNTTDGACRTIEPDDTVFPIHEYDHDAGCSITGGYVARDPSLGSLFGRYLYSDFCAGQIRSLVPGLPQATGDRSEGLAVSRPVSFGEDACGRLYVASLDGPVSRLVGDDPSDCGGGEVRVADGVLTVTALAAVRNTIEVTTSGSGAEWVVRDHSAPLDAGAGCTQVRPSRVLCAKAGVTGLEVDTGLRNDRVTTSSGLDADVHAGGGDDQVTTGDGTDSVAGGTGRDVLDAGPGPDLVDGGLHRDVVLYKSRGPAQPVDVSLDGVAGDGGALDAGADNVLPSVENVQGGAGADTLTGNAAPNALTGGPGADELHGLAGNDEIRAQDRGTADMITCGQGSGDHVFADANDVFPATGPDACELVN
jgi:Glucose / Sorbosone dehydrogenase/RTX calcium-binding nonapeptide repeat (4 copies)